MSPGAFHYVNVMLLRMYSLDPIKKPYSTAERTHRNEHCPLRMTS